MANKYNKNVQARISESTADKFHKFCREEGETVSSRIRRLIIRELNNHSYDFNNMILKNHNFRLLTLNN